MPLKVACPNGHPMLVRDEHAGKRVKCPTCREGFIAPFPVAAPDDAPPVTAPPLVKASIPLAMPDDAPVAKTSRPAPPVAPAPAPSPPRSAPVPPPTASPSPPAPRTTPTAPPEVRPAATRSKPKASPVAASAALAKPPADAPTWGPDPPPEWLTTLELARNPGTSVLDAHPLLVWPVTLSALFFFCAGGCAVLYLLVSAGFGSRSAPVAGINRPSTTDPDPGPFSPPTARQEDPRPPSEGASSPRQDNPQPDRPPRRDRPARDGSPREVPPTPPARGNRPFADRDFVSQVLDDLATNDFDKRKQALDKLTDVEPTGRRAEVIKALEKAIVDEDPILREAALNAYVNWADPEQSVPKLLELVENPDRRIRAIAIRGLADHQDDRAIVPLVKRLANADDRREASKALQSMGSKAEKEVIVCLQDPNLDVRQEACRILKTIGTNSSIAKLEQLLRTDADPLLKRLAKDAIDAINER